MNVEKKTLLQQQLEDQLKDYPENLDPDQVAEVLGCSRRYADGLITSGKLYGFALDPTKQRKEKRVPKSAIVGYIIQNKL